MKKIRQYINPAIIIAILLCNVTQAYTADKAAPVPRNPDTEYQLVVLHTNDHHGTTVSKDKTGGLAERASFFKQVRAQNKNVLVLDAGDINTGSALSNMFNAEPDIRAYNQLGYDAVVFGNHEFDKPLSVLRKQISWSKFPWLSANIKFTNGKYLGKPYIIKEYEGFRVAVIGITTLRTKVIAAPDRSLVFIDEIKAAQEIVRKLREDELADIVIVVGHLGDVPETSGHITSVQFAREVPGVDFIIDGHSHSKLTKALVSNGVPIVSAWEWGKIVGEAALRIKNGKIINFSWQPVEITSTAFEADAGINALLAPFIKKAEASLKEVIAETSAQFEFGNRLPRYRETALGDLVCDATASYVRSTGVNIDFALMNGGNIRAELPAGKVTREHILTVLPFDNYIYVVTLKGSDVIKLFDFIGTIKQGNGGFAQVSKEARYTISYDAQGNGKVSNITINGVAIDPAKTYKIATNDYLAQGGDGYTIFTGNTDIYNTSMLLVNVVIDYIKKQPRPLAPKTDGRLTIIGGAAE